MPRSTSLQASLAARRRGLLRNAAAKKLSALLITHEPDVSYLTGFEGDSSWLVLTRDYACLLTDGRFGEQARRECPGIETLVRKNQSLPAAVAHALKGRGVRRIGFQSHRVTVAVRDQLAEQVGERKLRTVSGMVSQLRIIKDAGELVLLRKAVRIAEKAFGELIARGAKGLAERTERDIAAELEYTMRKLGADGPSFETIVAAGPNGSNCHYRPAGRRLRMGEPLLIDWGARVGGYCSDLTRTLFLGTIPRKLQEVYEVVRRAQAAGIAACRQGAACKTPDAAARGVIEAAGYGDEFVHSLGHGVGREVHEAPGLAAKAKARLRKGMVVTVEPGIYLPGTGGVRIEDDILITPAGPRRLSSLPRGRDEMVLS